MKNTAFSIISTPIVISIICGFVIAVNSVISILPTWPFFGMLMITTITALFTVGAFLLVGFVQWLLQYLNNRTI